MKKTLNEEVSRIKSIMGCCKGKVNEDQENCVDPESEQGQQAIDKAAAYIEYELKQIGISDDDIKIETQDTPEIVDAKKKLGEILNPVLPDMDGPQLKAMIKEIRRILKDKKAGKQVSSDVNEQLGAAAGVLSQIEIFLLSIPTGTFIAVGAWLLLRLLKCYIYILTAKATGVVCGLDVNKNVMVKLLQLAFLDFRNLFTTDSYIYGCDRHLGR
jgi:hypothetical protein